jgi:hypothetical protein
VARARDYYSPDSGQWEEEFALAPRYTPLWLRMELESTSSDDNPEGLVGVQIQLPPLEELRDPMRGESLPSTPLFSPETVDKQTEHWRAMLVGPATRKGYRLTGEVPYRERAWPVILKATTVLHEGSPVGWYDLDNGFVRGATLWDLAHLKQGVPQELGSTGWEQFVEQEDYEEYRRVAPFIGRPLWLLSEKQWDEADFPPPIKHGPPFVKGVTAAAERGGHEARDAAFGEVTHEIVAPESTPEWLAGGDFGRVVVRMPEPNAAIWNEVLAPEDFDSPALIVRRITNEIRTDGDWTPNVTRARALYEDLSSAITSRPIKGWRYSPVNFYRADVVREMLQLFVIEHEGSTVWLYDFKAMQPVRVLTLFELIHWPTGSGSIEIDAGSPEEGYALRDLWPASEKQWEEGQLADPDQGGPEHVPGLYEPNRMQEMKANDHVSYHGYRIAKGPRGFAVEFKDWDFSNGAWTTATTTKTMAEAKAWIDEHRVSGEAGERKARDYPDMETALRGAQSKHDATHATRGPNGATVFSPTSRGYVKRTGYQEKGYFHWPERGITVDVLPSNAEMIHRLIDTGWDPEAAPERKPESMRRAAESPGAYLPINIGDTRTFESHGQTFAVKYHSRNTYVLSTVPPGQRRRWGNRDQIQKDIAYVIENGAMPPADRSKAFEAAPEGDEPLRDNPVDVADALPWVKVSRDPERYQEALKEAKAIGPIESAKSIYELLGPALLKEDQETFVVVLLDVRQQCRGVAEVHRGGRSRVSVSLIDVLRVVVASGAEGFVVVHNHPTGKATPSDADKDLTKSIERAAKLFDGDMKFVDHVICGNGEYYSFADRKVHHVKKAKHRGA